MAYEESKIIELFGVLSLEEKEDLLQTLTKMTDVEKRAPKKSYLETAWADIQREIRALSQYPYIDDQLEIDEIWNICGDIMKSGKIKDEPWDKRKRVISEIIRGEYFDDYSISDPMMELMAALCLNPEEELLCADLIYAIGSDYMKRDGAEIYKKYGKLEKYYEYLEQNLGNEEALYMELIEYYRDKDPDRAARIAELGLKQCRDDQTNIIIFLMKHAQRTGDKERFDKLLRGARCRRAVNFSKVQEQVGC